ncbi:DUF1489 family protein [Litoreibacter roseus]|uniref:Lysophospholipase n=1 Tax=Litoreibacter roseus TaxID=2601869 RepID=A0A6N6JBG5_9RHOB|nr:DUF1489 domain-containing protein [Litoreibacter roseus]GFE63394.1 lysophospholipase [Litoreibacter roseus]
MADHINLIKLSVGSESVADIAHWQKHRSKQLKGGQYYHLTRMWPKREADLLNGGSIYWVVSGVLQCRQRVLRLDEIIGKDGIRRCGLILDPEIVLTEHQLKRPFQGWRYLKPEDASRDLPAHRASDEAIPPKLSAALAEIGVR